MAEEKKEEKKGPISRTSLFVLIMGIAMTAFFAIQSVAYFAVYFDTSPRGGGSSASVRQTGHPTGGANGTFMQAWLGWNNSSSAKKEGALTSAIVMAIFAAGSVSLIVLGAKRLRPPVVEEPEPTLKQLWRMEAQNQPRRRRRRDI